MSIFRIERDGEAKRFRHFQTSHASQVGERRLLWHGSPSVNFIGILSQGLRGNAQHKALPGRQGSIFFADIADKSTGYSLKSNSASMVILLLLCEVELGKGLTPNTVRGSIAYLSPGSTDYNRWCDAGKVHPDLKGILMPDVSGGHSSATRSAYTTGGHKEWVVSDPAQVRQRYLFQVKVTTGGYYY
ncbi:hypothetical protein N7532_006823 [Penicillium argentinense]|uniref:Poly [ADP-ribose] polymerase n=1 Tax=Penicillium argentinense TaxID=1131581 RepID=A0A9W9FGL9_9EURO|nr:uncharacterized protein N7532_006823 [Penicillium argentinense]KAJ5099822.1 hypothetical protein N7532_006823 [Penicillium argentinense]